MLKEACISTIEYLESKSKTERKKIGQFFTSRPAAEFMGGLFEVKSKAVRIADPGAGTGILASAMLEHIFKASSIKSVSIDLYENDENVLPTLEQNIAYWKRIADNKGISLVVTLITDNFITHNRVYGLYAIAFKTLTKKTRFL